MRRQIEKRIRDRASGVLRPLGRWPQARRFIPIRAIAARLEGTCPGALADYDIDHVRPLASFDLRKDADVAAAFAPDNHRWLQRGANRQKGAR